MPPAAGRRAGLRADLALCRQDRVLQDAAKCFQRQDQDRTRFRRRSTPSRGGAGQSRHQRGRSGLAARALEAGLVDELRLFVVPIAVGAARGPCPTHVRLELELLDERRFDSAIVYLHYRIRNATSRT